MIRTFFCYRTLLIVQHGHRRRQTSFYRISTCIKLQLKRFEKINFFSYEKTKEI